LHRIALIRFGSGDEKTAGDEAKYKTAVLSRIWMLMMMVYNTTTGFVDFIHRPEFQTIREIEVSETGSVLVNR
jgi:hypothetical protein